MPNYFNHIWEEERNSHVFLKEISDKLNVSSLDREVNLARWVHLLTVIIGTPRSPLFNIYIYMQGDKDSNRERDNDREK